MTNLKNDYYNLSFILSRVLNTGTIMSIEKNEKEIPGLENKIKKLTKKSYVSTFNGYTGALHASVISYSSGFGDVFKIPNPTKKEIQFLKWLGVRYSDVSENLERIHFTFDNLNEINSNKINQQSCVIFYNSIQLLGIHIELQFIRCNKTFSSKVYTAEDRNVKGIYKCVLILFDYKTYIG